MNDNGDYKYTKDHKIKRDFISCSVMVDGLYERSSKLHTRPYGDDRYWESENHIYEEIAYYRRAFNSIILKPDIANKIEDGGIEHTGKPSCYCIDCILQDKLNRITVGSTIHTLSGAAYNQVYKNDRPHIVKHNNTYYNVVSTKKTMLNKEVPLTEFLDTCTHSPRYIH